MPRTIQNKYYAEGPLTRHTITHMSHTIHSCARNSTALYPQPYTTTSELIDRIDSVGQAWYWDMGEDLHQRNFIWLTRMQSARRMGERMRRFPSHDLVLERLLEEGIFNCREPDMPDACEEFTMNYAASVSQRLLMQIENLEREVGWAHGFLPWYALMTSDS